ncbi:MAG: hypothetical protein M1818_003757 [Claussenomyces sp. TS43310]|nr:MAG: hypothetical protein M1818_003757 [Claussenomyces sp. TS43310]
MALKYANHSAANPCPEPSTQGVFTLHVPAPTDIWRKPPGLDVLDAPIIYQSVPVSTFQRARVTVTGDWKTAYDQGGLVLVFPEKKSGTQKTWVKSGIEFYHGGPVTSTVAADAWADWSLTPLTGANEAAGRVTVEFEREEEEDGTFGSVLRVWLVGEGGDKTPIREVTWAFHDLHEDEEMWVGIYGARPTKDERDTLEVKLEGFEIDFRT